MEIIVLSLIIILVITATYLKRILGKVNNLETVLELEKEEKDKILHQKKSSEVRLGKIAENMAPFFKDWPYDPNNFRFLGNPIDGISFNDDGVVLVEIKSGAARLSKGQKQIRDFVKGGKVKFVSFRIDENGTTLKVESEFCEETTINSNDDEN